MSSKPFKTIAQRVAARGRKVNNINKRTKDDSPPGSSIDARDSRNDSASPKSNLNTRSSKNAGVSTPGDMSPKSAPPTAILVDINNSAHQRTTPMKTRSATAGLKSNSTTSDRNSETDTSIEPGSPRPRPVKRQRQDNSLPVFFFVFDEMPDDTKRESSVINPKLGRCDNSKVIDNGAITSSNKTYDLPDINMKEATD
ncbi:11021_t:CDS:1, partial [Acaulospora colombiana]